MVVLGEGKTSEEFSGKVVVGSENFLEGLISSTWQEKGFELYTPENQQRPEIINHPDSINHPDHYNWLPGVECIKVTQHFSFNLGNAIKYIWRAGRKPDNTVLQDLRKAVKYLEYEIKKIESEV